MHPKCEPEAMQTVKAVFASLFVFSQAAIAEFLVGFWLRSNRRHCRPKCEGTMGFVKVKPPCFQIKVW